MPTRPREQLAPQLKAGTAADAATPAPTAGRAQRYSAQLTLSVKNIDALSNATQEALRITRDLGGYLVTASYATSDTGVSSLTLKVPTANVQDAIVRLSGLGKIVAQQVQIDDLQGQVDELTKHETALREQIARLSARLAATDLDAETRAGLEARRGAARSALAQVRAARAQVNAEARYATIQLNVQTRESAAVPAVPSRFDGAVDRAVEILGFEALIVLYALVIVGPLALLALLVWLARRGLRRRQDEQLLSTPVGRLAEARPVGKGGILGVVGNVRELPLDGFHRRRQLDRQPASGNRAATDDVEDRSVAGAEAGEDARPRARRSPESQPLDRA